MAAATAVKSGKFSLFRRLSRKELPRFYIYSKSGSGKDSRTTPFTV